jgi:dihydroneopterin aldolase
MEDFGKKLLLCIIEKMNPDSVIIKINKLSIPFKHSFDRAGIEIKWVKDGEGKRDKV